MNEFILHVLLIWGLLSITLILFYQKQVVERQIEHNMYSGNGRSYNKKKARSIYLRLAAMSAVIANGVVYLLSFLS
jgi:ABC-type Fe3+ transport system permease subunit